MRVPVQRLSRSTPWICRQCRALSSVSKGDAPQRRPSQKLPETPARTRFAPSPTGYLHLGSLRTALFNYLTAKATGGQFVLRLEDTDKKRTVDDAESRLYEDLRWTGLQWDEGPDIGGPFGPYKQSERVPLYQKHAASLVDSGHAYRCFCSTARLNSLAYERNRLGLPSDYDRACEGITKDESDERLSKGEPHVVRLKLPDMAPQFTDLVYGVVGQRQKKEKPQSQQVQLSYEDPILIKSDGLPTYHLANVVDDHEMGITHVIRAVEWMSSTPKHVVMYNAFNWKPPTFAHVGLLQDSSRQKFSKRDFALDIRSLKTEGIFAGALVNYVALFGWSHRLGDDFLNLQDLIQNFDMKFTKGNTVVTPNKLKYLQKRYAQSFVEEGGEKFNSMVDRIVTAAQQHVELHPETQFCYGAELRERAAALVRVDAANYTTPMEFFERNSQFLCLKRRREYTPRHDDQTLRNTVDSIEHCFEQIRSGKWGEQILKQSFDDLIEELSKNWGTAQDQVIDARRECRKSVQQFLRWALTGGYPGPVLMQTMTLLGRDVSLQRIKDATASFKKIIDKVD